MCILSYRYTVNKVNVWSCTCSVYTRHMWGSCTTVYMYTRHMWRSCTWPRCTCGGAVPVHEAHVEKLYLYIHEAHVMELYMYTRHMWRSCTCTRGTCGGTLLAKLYTCTPGTCGGTRGTCGGTLLNELYTCTVYTRGKNEISIFRCV